MCNVAVVSTKVKASGLTAYRKQSLGSFPNTAGLLLPSSFHAAVSTDMNFFPPGIGIYTLFLGGGGGVGLLNITAYPEFMMSNWISV